MKSHRALLKCYPCLRQRRFAFPGAQLHRVSSGNGEAPGTQGLFLPSQSSWGTTSPRLGPGGVWWHFSCEGFWGGLASQGKGRSCSHTQTFCWLLWVHPFGSLDLPLIKPKGLQSNFEILQTVSVSRKYFLFGLITRTLHFLICLSCKSPSCLLLHFSFFKGGKKVDTTQQIFTRCKSIPVLKQKP